MTPERDDASVLRALGGESSAPMSEYTLVEDQG